MRDPLLDLLLGSRCAVCHVPGRLLCSVCSASLPQRGLPALPEPAPSGLVAPYAAGAYAPPLGPLIVGLKERRQIALAAPLGRVLAAVVADLVGAEAGLAADPVLLVPVPSSARARRARGHDHTLRLARFAAAEARRSGLPALAVPLLRHRGGGRDQVGLSRKGREQNAHGRFRVGRGALRLARRHGGLVVVVDDVLTTGHTLREAQRTLARAGLVVLGGAVVAATERRADPGGDNEVHPPYRAGTAEANV